MFNHEEPIVRMSSYNLIAKKTPLNKGKDIEEQMELVEKFL
jgi:hypothetical protein